MKMCEDSDNWSKGSGSEGCGKRGKRGKHCDCEGNSEGGSKQMAEAEM
jgi:hypothetical protein